MAEPINWPRRQGGGYTRYMLWPPNLASGGTIRSMGASGGLTAIPVILPRPYYVAEIMLFQSGLGSVNDKGRIALYDNRWVTLLGYRDVPYPNRLLWEGAQFTLDNFSGTKITRNPNMVLPGQKIFWIVTHFSYTEFGSGSFHTWSGGGGYPAHYQLIGSGGFGWGMNGNANLINPDPFTEGALVENITGFAVWYVTIGDPP